jgi:hypothetical protein
LEHFRHVGGLISPSSVSASATYFGASRTSRVAFRNP